MSQLDFIKDVIYGLKMEYGQGITLSKPNKVVNLDTGAVTGIATTKYIDKAIALPLDRRNAFLKSVGIHSEALVEINQQQFLIDKDDLGAFLPEINDQCENKEIKLVENYTYAFILTVSMSN